jgi:hypothetical protein
MTTEVQQTSLTLSDEDLVRLTGYKHGSRQARWVRDNLGLEPMIGADGHPRLTWAIVEQAALARRAGATATATSPASVSSLPQPNWRRAA